MPDVIDFLQRLGEDSTLRYASRPVLDRALIEAQMSPELRVALASSDQRLLETLLGTSTKVCCLIYKPLGDEDEDEKPQKGKDGKSKDGDSISNRLQLSRIA